MKRKSIQFLRVMALAVSAMLVTGCAGGAPQVPEGWVERPATPADVADTPPARMQMLICYGQVSSHVLIRLVDPDSKTGRELIMWDPGGAYGIPNRRALTKYRDGDPASDRQRDVILGRVPSLDEYWDYRQHLEARNGAMAVFEWTTTPDQMQQLWMPLEYGVTVSGEPYATDIGGMWCGTATGDYLQRFAKTLVPHAGNDLNPSTMASRLWKKDHPYRVILYQTNQPTVVYEKKN